MHSAPHTVGAQYMFLECLTAPRLRLRSLGGWVGDLVGPCFGVWFFTALILGFCSGGFVRFVALRPGFTVYLKLVWNLTT